MTLRLTIILSFLLITFSFAQEQNGIAHSNYAGVNGMFINPSSIADSRNWLDINVVGLDAFINNNYVYLDKNEFKWLYHLSNTDQFPDASENLSREFKSADADILGLLPSATCVLGKHAVGLHTGVRAYANGNNIPPQMAKFMFEGFDYLPEYQMEFKKENMSLNTMQWAEVGLTYATIIKQQGKEMLKGGITIKRLLGINSTAVIFDKVDYQIYDTTSMQLNELNASYAYVEPGTDNRLFMGKGFGFDLGITYVNTKEDVTHYIPHSRQNSCRYADYWYRLGFSILDVGAIRFNEGVNRVYTSANGNWDEFYGYTMNDLYDLEDLFEEGMDSTGALPEIQNGFKSRLPTAFSFQVDYNLGNNVYINSTLIKAVKRRDNIGVHRGDLLSVVPRYETRRLEFALPIGLYNFTKPQLGFMFRFNNIIIGSDKIGALFFRQNVYGADIYFNLKVSIMNRKICRDKVKARRFISRKGTCSAFGL